MEVFGIIGMSFGSTAFVFALVALNKVANLEKQLKEAIIVNGATEIVLNFANYIDWSCYGSCAPDSLTTKIWDFIERIHEVAGIPVGLVGTGPCLNQVIYLRSS